MSDFPWIAKYPKGVPAMIDPDRVANIPSLLDGIAQKHPDAPAFTNMGVTLTTQQAQSLSCDLAAYLQSLPDMQKGDRVAIMMPNLLQYPVALFGILRAGFIVVNVNPLYTARELEHQLRDSGAKVAGSGKVTLTYTYMVPEGYEDGEEIFGLVGVLNAHSLCHVYEAFVACVALDEILVERL